MTRLKPQAKGKPQSGPTPLTPSMEGEVEYLGGQAPLPPQRPPPLKQVIEAYFSDLSLKQDRFMYNTIRDSPGGWVDIDVVVGLKRVRALKANREEVMRVVRGSRQVELWHDPADSSAAIRRSQGRPLPKLETQEALPADCEEEDEALPAEEEPKPPPRRSATPKPPPGTPLRKNGASLLDEDVVVPDAKRARAEPAEVRPGNRYVGRIKSFHKVLRMGFIACKPTFAAFEKDIALDRNEVAGFGVGDVVSFTLAVDPDFGTPKAEALKAAGEAELDRPVQPTPALQSTARPARLPARAKSRPARPEAAAPSDVTAMRFVGKVLSMDEETRMGKISCPQTFGFLGCHVTVGEAESAGFEAGDRVSFSLRAGRAVELEAE
mmetsp:Transcript_66382/g.130803  ORF Transcript_66382/g.130803 Transcript_66382/m.130803 type:complete len:379 (+) Transcript_66382:61-1197(+)